MTRGGSREGAGRPPTTYRRITLDEEAAQHLGELLAHYQAHWPQAHWTAAKLLSYIVTDAWRHQLQEPRRLGF